MRRHCKFSHLPFWLGLGIGVLGALGVFWGIVLEFDDGNDEFKFVEQESSLNENNENTDRSVNQVSESTSAITLALQATSPLERQTRLYSWIRTASEGKVLELFEKYSNFKLEFEPKFRKEIVVSLSHKLASLDPVNALAAAMAIEAPLLDHSLRQIFQQWLSVNTDQMLDYVGSLDHTEWFGFTIQTIAFQCFASIQTPETWGLLLKKRDDFDPASASLFMSIVTGSINNTPTSDYTAMWENLLEVAEDENDFYSRSALTTVATSWVKHKGFRVLDSVVATQSETSPVVRSVLGQTLHHLAQDVPSTTFEYLIQKQNEFGLIDYYSNRDVNEDKRFFIYFEPRERARFVRDVRNALGSAIRNWAKNDSASVFEAILGLPHDGLLKQHLLEWSIEGAARQNPRDLFQYCDSLPPRVQYKCRTEAAGTLADSNPEQVRAMVLNASFDQEQKDQLMCSILAKLAKANPKLGFETAIELGNCEGDARFQAWQSIDRSLFKHISRTFPRSVEGIVVLTLANHNLSAAVDLLPEVSDENMLDAFKAVGARLISQGETEQAVQLGKQYASDPKVRLPYYRVILREWYRIDKEGFIRQVERGAIDIPSADLARLIPILLWEFEKTTSDNDFQRLAPYVLLPSG